MTDFQSQSALRMDGAAYYCIQIQGILDVSWIGRIGGLAMTVKNADSGQPTTALCGKVTDQAALLGVLNTLYNLRLPLLSVERRYEETHRQAA